MLGMSINKNIETYFHPSSNFLLSPTPVVTYVSVGLEKHSKHAAYYGRLID